MNRRSKRLARNVTLTLSLTMATTGCGQGDGEPCGKLDGVCPASCSAKRDADCPEKADYYVAPDGDDANAGDLAHPFKTLNRAHEVATPGTLVYFREGTYHPRDPERNGTSLEGIDGRADAMIRFWAYPGERVVFDFSTLEDNQYPLRAIMFSGHYWHWKGFDVVGTPQYPGQSMSAAFVVGDSSHCIFEQMRIHDNFGTGFILKGSSTDNLVLNCDAYDNQDPVDGYENANGFMSVTDEGTSNTFRGCRAWWNADDGFDHFNGNGVVIHEGCWSFWNGYIAETFEHGGTGNGMGFKFGDSQYTQGRVTRVATGCLAFENYAFGFDQNALRDAIRVQNCTAFKNVEYGIRLPHQWPEYTPLHVVQNCVAYENGRDAFVNAGSTDDHNSWNTDVTVTDADFLSLDSEGVDGPRGLDGSLPELDFLKLAPDSDLIDRGVDVELPYAGKAPDLGAFETD
jgi:hypothetical protein